MNHFGFDKSIGKEVENLKIFFEKTSPIKVLDAGCGTGIIGLTLCEKLNVSDLLFTDINTYLLNHVKKNTFACTKKTKISFAYSDISSPDEIKINNDYTQLAPQSFDIVATGAALGYAKDQKYSLEKLLSLVKPDGYFLNIEMNEGVFGKFVSWKYKYPIIALSKIEEIIKHNNFLLTKKEDLFFPASLTRVCYLAKNQQPKEL
jgi:ubiquinone/menaquinone biosynthesis C-methylase UbiE